MAPLGSGNTGSLDNRNAMLPLPLGSTASIDLNNPVGLTVFAANPNNVNSSVQQWNLQVQRQLPNNWVLSVGYVGTTGKHLMFYYDTNRQVFNSPNGTRSYPQLGSVNVQESRGNSIYHALQTQIERRFASGFTLRGAYTWSHAIDDSNGTFDAGQPADITNFALERASSSMDIRHRWVFSTLYELPFGRGKKFGSQMNRLADMVAGGWQMNAIWLWQSGQPVNITQQDGQPGNNRPDTNGPIQVNAGNANQYLVASSFTAVPRNADGVLLRPGTLGRNAIYGPGLNQLDLSLFKNFSLTERLKLQFALRASTSPTRRSLPIRTPRSAAATSARSPRRASPPTVRLKWRCACSFSSAAGLPGRPPPIPI